MNCILSAFLSSLLEMLGSIGNRQGCIAVDSLMTLEDFSNVITIKLVCIHLLLVPMVSIYTNCN